MCGRIDNSDPEGIARLLQLLGLPGEPAALEPPRYNVAPDAKLLAISCARGQYHCGHIRWGLLPNWATPEQFARPLINARSESVWDKPSFREAIRRRRLLVPISGFYEWQRETRPPHPFHFRHVEQSALLLAAVWERDPQGLPGCALMTTAANTEMATIHHRMPVILPAEAAMDWLRSQDRHQLDSLLQPLPEGQLQITEVCDAVNDARHDSPRCLLPAGEGGSPRQTALL